MSGFAAAWSAYLCSMHGHIVHYVAASTSATQIRYGVCDRCGRHVLVDRAGSTRDRA